MQDIESVADDRCNENRRRVVHHHNLHYLMLAVLRQLDLLEQLFDLRHDLALLIE